MQAGSGRIMAGQRSDAPSSKPTNSLTIPGIVIESWERPTVVMESSLSCNPGQED